MKTLKGYDAIEYAEQHGLRLSMYNSPIEDARDGLTVDEAREIAREDAGLIYLVVEHPRVMLHERSVDYGAAEMMMDDDLREEVHSDLAPCTEQEFMDEYARRHAERFGSEFVVG